MKTVLGIRDSDQAAGVNESFRSCHGVLPVTSACGWRQARGRPQTCRPTLRRAAHRARSSGAVRIGFCASAPDWRTFDVSKRKVVTAFIIAALSGRVEPRCLEGVTAVGVTPSGVCRFRDCPRRRCARSSGNRRDADYCWRQRRTPFRRTKGQQLPADPLRQEDLVEAIGIQRPAPRPLQSENAIAQALACLFGCLCLCAGCLPRARCYLIYAAKSCLSRAGKTNFRGIRRRIVAVDRQKAGWATIGVIQL